MAINITISFQLEKQWKQFTENMEGMVIQHCYRSNTGLEIAHSIDNGKHHISISSNSRQPSWNEIKEIKYNLLPDLPMHIALPPQSEYVNIHKNCFHIWEV